MHESWFAFDPRERHRPSDVVDVVVVDVVDVVVVDVVNVVVANVVKVDVEVGDVVGTVVAVVAFTLVIDVSSEDSFSLTQSCLTC